MPKFIVEVREVHISYQEVEANNRDDAVNLVSAGKGTANTLEYSHQLPKEEWAVLEDGTTYYYNDFTHKFDRKIG